MSRAFSRLFAFLALSALGLVLWRVSVNDNDRSDLSFDAGPVIEKVQAMSSLTTLKVQIADAVVRRLPGKTGSLRVVLVVKGEAALGVDLSEVRIEQVDSSSRRGVLKLPQPKVQYARIDLQHSNVIDLASGGLWAIVPGGGDAEATAINRAYSEAEQIVAASAIDPALIQRCRVHTAEVLRSFTALMGWDLQIQWQDMP